MFYEVFTKLCKEKGVSPTATLKKLNISTSKLTAWKNGSMPNSEFLIPISEFFGVTADYLLTGEEKNSSLTADEQRLLDYYKKLSDFDKGRLIERAETMSESTDNQSSEEVNADFSDEKIFR